MNTKKFTYRQYAIVLLSAFSLFNCGGSSGSHDDASVIAPPTLPPIMSEPPANQVELIDQALSCSPTDDSTVQAGTDLSKLTLTQSNAVCNDGTPAVMYVRKASEPVLANTWLIFFQGGSHCRGADCAQRWCDSKARMTSSLAPDAIAGDGMFSRRLMNESQEPYEPHKLGSANQVFVYYCSSDNFAGQAALHQIPSSNSQPAFELFFNGQYIVDAVIDTLMQGAVSDDLRESLPVLMDYSELAPSKVILSGTSAGCLALAHNADRIADRLNISPNELFSICDSNFGPDVLYDIDDQNIANQLLAIRKASYVQRSENANIARDASCVAFHESEPWVCDRAAHVVAYHMTNSQVLIKTDLRDPVIAQGYLNAGMTPNSFSRAARQGLLRVALQTINNNAEETPYRPISVLAPTCQKHGALRSDIEFFETRFLSEILEEGETIQEDLSLNQALVKWINGASVEAIDTVPATISSCG